jgi:capsular polysaccharide transport system ATP-binding protein
VVVARFAFGAGLLSSQSYSSINVVIRLDNVTKYYATAQGRKYVFKNLSFELPEKTNIGVLGLNGSGKTTLLRMIGGIDYPNEGCIDITGSISWPLGLSGGTQNSLSGRENASFVCRVYGQNAEAIEEKLAFILDFSELGDYFDLPVKTYSSGMRSKLMFAMSMAFDFDIYLIDEITAVGDARFREKSQQALLDKRKRSNYIMVSHNVNDLIKDSDSLLVLGRGDVQLFSDTAQGLAYYKEIVQAKK